MSVVSLSTFEGTDGGASKSLVGRAMDIRQENDRRRIKVDGMIKDQPDMYVRGRPGTAPFSASRSGGGDVSAFAIEGPKKRAASATRARNQRNQNKLSQSTSSLDIHGASPKKVRPHTVSSQSPTRTTRRGRSTSPLKNIKESGGDDVDEEDNENGAFLTSATSRRLVARDVLSERDRAALKMGRLILQTLMDKPEISTEDSVSRFFFDNWLSKSGSNTQSADSYSIELMTHLQAQIATAKAEAEDDITQGNMNTLDQMQDRDTEQPATDKVVVKPGLTNQLVSDM